MYQIIIIISGPGEDAVKTTYGTYVKHNDYTDMIYTQAQAICRVSGAEIAAYETKLEYETLKPHLTGMIQYWLNGNDRRQRGKFLDICKSLNHYDHFLDCSVEPCIWGICLASIPLPFLGLTT